MPVGRWEILGRDAHRDMFGGHVLRHYGIGANGRSLTDRDGAEYLSACADDYIVLDGGVALSLSEYLATEGDTVVKHDAIANLGGFTDDDAHAVVNKEAATDSGARVDFHAGKEAVNLR